MCFANSFKAGLFWNEPLPSTLTWTARLVIPTKMVGGEFTKLLKYIFRRV
jgi:hypothetical protein